MFASYFKIHLIFYGERVFFVNMCSSRHVSLGKIIWFYNNIFRKHNRCCCCCNWNYGWCVKYILFLRRIFTLFYTTSVTVRGEGKTGIVFDHFFSGMCECTNTRCFVKYARLLFLLSAGDVWIYSTNKNSTDSSSALRQYMILCYKKLCMLS